jgi:hypothetical protein
MDEKIYECEAKKPVVRDGVKVREWRVVPVAEVIAEQLSEYRCKDCHGRVRLHRKRVKNAPAPHAEHLSRQDSEYCPKGMYFRQSPGRQPRLSLQPVE